MLDKLITFSEVKDIRIEQDPNRMRPIDADLQIPDIKKFQSHTGWVPEIEFEKTMLDLLNYWRENIKKERVYIDR